MGTGSVSWGRVQASPLTLPASAAHSPSTEMSWMAKRRMMVQIMPRVIFRFPSTISAGWGQGESYLVSKVPATCLSDYPCSALWPLSLIPGLAPSKYLIVLLKSDSLNTY